MYYSALYSLLLASNATIFVQEPYVCSNIKRVVCSNYPKNNTLRLKLCCHVLVNAVVLLLIVNGILIVPTKISPRNFAFRGLVAMPQELSNDAFDLLDDELRGNLYEELGIIQPNIIQDTSLPGAFGVDWSGMDKLIYYPSLTLHPPE